MEGANKKHISESFRLAAVLALVGGFLDAYTYICRGQVFSNAQTGNIVLVGLALAENNFINAIYHFLPVIAFIVGVIITETIKRRVKFKETFIHWRQIVIGAEIIILFAIAFIPMGRYDGLVNISISLICAMQVEAFRKVNGTALSTTMCTGNLRTGTEQVYRAIIEKSKDNSIKEVVIDGKQITVSDNMNFNFELLSEPKRKGIFIKRFTKEESKIIGYMYKFKLTLHPVLHQLIHNTGLGDKVNLGFGCIEILE